MSWYLAKSLDTLRKQVNDLYPTRNKTSDGTIGDTAHLATKSDHNPRADGTVCALDLTHDPATLDCNRLVEALVTSRDKRISYIIWNGRIINSEVSPWMWRTYTGTNKHTRHVHISVKYGAIHNDTTPWKLDLTPVTRSPSKELQTLLNKLGAYPALVVDGLVGPKTKEALAKAKVEYQTLLSLEKEIS